MSEALGFLEKWGTLLQSRRFIVLMVAVVWGIIQLVTVIAPVIGADIDTGGMPTEEAVAATVGHYIAQAAALIAAALTILGTLFASGKTNESYGNRPAGADRYVEVVARPD